MNEKQKKLMWQTYQDMPLIIRMRFGFELFSIAYQHGYMAKQDEIVGTLTQQLERLTK